MTTSLTVDGIDKAQNVMRVMSRRVTAPGPSLWNSVGKYLRAEFAEQFKTQGAHFGRPWKPLKPSYAMWKAARGRGGRGILVFNGSLRDSYTKKMQAVQRVDGKQGAVFGSGNRLALFHEYGTHSHHTGRQILPARKVIVRTPKMNADIASIIAKYVVGKQDPAASISEDA